MKARHLRRLRFTLRMAAAVLVPALLYASGVSAAEELVARNVVSYEVYRAAYRPLFWVTGESPRDPRMAGSYGAWGP